MASIKQTLQQLTPLHLRGLLSGGNETIHASGAQKHSGKIPPLITIITAISTPLTGQSFLYRRNHSSVASPALSWQSNVLNKWQLSCFSSVAQMGQTAKDEERWERGGWKLKWREVEPLIHTITRIPILRLYTLGYVFTRQELCSAYNGSTSVPSFSPSVLAPAPSASFPPFSAHQPPESSFLCASPGCYS